MRCAQCGDEIRSKPVKQDGEIYCSLECAYIAAGIDPEEEEGYYDEDPIEKAFEDEED